MSPRHQSVHARSRRFAAVLATMALAVGVASAGGAVVLTGDQASAADNVSAPTDATQTSLLASDASNVDTANDNLAADASTSATQHMKLQSEHEIAHGQSSDVPTYTVQPVNTDSSDQQTRGVIRIVRDSDGQCISTSGDTENGGVHETDCGSPDKGDWFIIIPAEDEPTADPNVTHQFYLKSYVRSNNCLWSTDNGLQGTNHVVAAGPVHYYVNRGLDVGCNSDAGAYSDMRWQIMNDPAGQPNWQQFLQWASEYSFSHDCVSTTSTDCSVASPEHPTDWFGMGQMAAYVRANGKVVDLPVGCVPGYIDTQNKSTTATKTSVTVTSTVTNSNSTTNSKAGTFSIGITLGVPEVFGFNASGGATFTTTNSTVHTTTSTTSFNDTLTTPPSMWGGIRQNQSVFEVDAIWKVGKNNGFHEWVAGEQTIQQSIDTVVDQGGSTKHGYSYTNINSFEKKDCDLPYEAPSLNSDASQPTVHSGGGGGIDNVAEGDVLTAEPGEWSVPNDGGGGVAGFAYQWFKNGTAIPGATSQSYVVAAVDVPSGTSANSITVAVYGLGDEHRSDQTNAVQSTNAAKVPASSTDGKAPKVSFVNGLNTWFEGSRSSAFLTQAGAPNMNVQVTGGTLPDGVSIDPTTGLLQGIPAQQGTYTFTATDMGSGVSAGFTLNVATRAGSAAVSVSVLPNARGGQSFSSDLVQLTGNSEALAFDDEAAQILQRLGLQYDQDAGTLSGTVSSFEPVDHIYTLNAADPDDGRTYSLRLTVVGSSAAFYVEDGAAVDATVGSYAWVPLGYSTRDDAISITGDVPAGLTADGGTLSGTPTAVGDWPLVIHVGDQERSVTVHVGARSLPGASVGQQYSAPTVDMTTVTPTEDGSFHLTASGLPDGLRFDPETGAISGVPTQAGEFNVAIGQDGTFIDGPGQATSAVFSLSVVPAAGQSGAGDGATGTGASTIDDAGSLSPDGSGVLARTGAEWTWLVIAAAILVIGGALIIVGMRIVRRARR